jgi:hypothetical protein
MIVGRLVRFLRDETGFGGEIVGVTLKQNAG